jgi:hypothetical protein
VLARAASRSRRTLSADPHGGGGGRLEKKLSPHWLRHAHGSHAHQRGAPRGHHSRHPRPRVIEQRRISACLYVCSAPTDGPSPVLESLIRKQLARGFIVGDSRVSKSYQSSRL